MGEEGAKSGVHVAYVGSVTTIELRGTDANEVHFCGGYLCVVSREPQPPRSDVLLEELSKSLLVEGCGSPRQHFNTVVVDIDAHDLVAQFSHRGCVHRPEVPAADH